MSREPAAIVLAAGAGTRMRSRLPKLLHPVAGRPILAWVLRALAEAGIERRIVVLGAPTRAAEDLLEPTVIVAWQERQAGTGDAARAAASAASGADDVIIINGDMPLIRPETVRELYRAHCEREATLSLLTSQMAHPTGIGRIQRRADGTVQAVIEERDASDAIRDLHEINAGLYCFKAAWLWPQLEHLQRSPITGELYLTTLVATAAAQGCRIVTSAAPEEEIRGVNTRAELAEAERLARKRVHERLFDCGVTLIDPATTYIDVEAEIGQDTVIHPNSSIWGASRVGEDCRIGPGTILRASRVGDRCTVLASVLEEAAVADDVMIGPFSHLRPGAEIGDRCELGNYAEVKGAQLGPGTRMHHVGYIGDASVGAEVNIGAGTITCNFDGQRKHRTEIGDSAFVGSDTMLVAPVSIGAGARTGAGSVVTRDVEAGALVAGVPARPLQRTPPREEERQPS